MSNSSESRGQGFLQSFGGVVKRCLKRIPSSIKQRLEDRLFYAIFQTTRVTNDNYGWRPKSKERKP
ncbi:MAG: hypothetical protein VXZ96_16650 [Myxococcota bacterium]|nr:hypothetical protein [Myxococcota bacterium]